MRDSQRIAFTRCSPRYPNSSNKLNCCGVMPMMVHPTPEAHPRLRVTCPLVKGVCPCIRMTCLLVTSLLSSILQRASGWMRIPMRRQQGSTSLALRCTRRIRTSCAKLEHLRPRIGQSGRVLRPQIAHTSFHILPAFRCPLAPIEFRLTADAAILVLRILPREPIGLITLCQQQDGAVDLRCKG